MASVQRRTRNGRTRYVARWRDADGRAHSRTFDRAADAKRHGAQAEIEARDRPDVAELRRTLTVQTWLDQWLTRDVALRVKADDLGAKSAAGYESNSRLHIVPAVGDVPLRDLTIHDVKTLMLEMVAAGHAPGTAKSVRATLSAALTAAGDAELVDRNVAQLAKPPTVQPLDPSTFTDAELQAIIDACQDHRLGSAIVWTALVGRRASEVVGLDWTDIDLDATPATYQVRRTVQRVPTTSARVARPGLHTRKRGKTTASGRRRTMSPAAADVLRHQRRRQAAEQLAATTWIGCDRVWTSTIGTPLESRQLYKALRQVMDAADVPHESPVNPDKGRGLHELRRTWTERLRRAGVAAEDVVTLGGWSNPSVMMRHYAAVPQTRQAAAAGHAADGLDLHLDDPDAV